MNELQIFNSEKFGRIRAVERGSEPWFCLADVCKPLDLRVSDCRKRLKPEGVDTINTLTAGGVQGMLYVNEGNLYRAIFQSKKPEAEEFTAWVTEEVLPALRKHGTYTVPARLAPEVSPQRNCKPDSRYPPGDAGYGEYAPGGGRNGKRRVRHLEHSGSRFPEPPNSRTDVSSGDGRCEGTNRITIFPLSRYEAAGFFIVR